MAVFIRKFYDLILNRRTVPRTSSLDHAGIERRPAEIFADDFVRLLVRIRQPAGFLINLYALRIGREGERHNTLITELLFHLGKIDAPLVNTRRSSCFKAHHLHAVCLQRIRQMCCRLQAVRSRICAHITVNTPRIQINAGTENGSLTVVNRAGNGLYARQNTVFHDQLRNLHLADRQMIGIFENLAHRLAVRPLVCLRTQRMHRRSLRLIQHFRLNKRFVNIFTHLAAERIDLFYEVSLRRASDVRVARHHGDAVDTYRKYNRFQPHPRCRKCCLASRMACADDGNINCFF